MKTEQCKWTYREGLWHRACCGDLSMKLYGKKHYACDEIPGDRCCPDCGCDINVGEGIIEKEPSEPANQFYIDLGFELNKIREMIVAKNKGYGNSALDPVRIFSKADPIEQLKVRIDDKLSRLTRGNIDAVDENFEEVINDLIGYLVLLKIATKKGE